MSAIARIGSALKYDACESLLASGRSLADVLAFAAAVAEVSSAHDDSPASSRPTEYPATVRPGKVAR